MVSSVSFEGTCLLVPQYTIRAKQELCWNRESRIKVCKLQDSGIKEECVLKETSEVSENSYCSDCRSMR
jgi:hypothetical protein